MRIAVTALVFGLLAVTAQPASAQPATPQEADRLTGVLQSFTGNTPGYAKVEPDGDRYKVSLDFMALITRLAKASGESADGLSVSPAQFFIAPAGAGKWAVTQNQPFDWHLEAGQGSSLRLRADAVDFEGVFDEADLDFTHYAADLKGFSLEQHAMEPESPQSDVIYSAESMHVVGNGGDNGKGGFDGKTTSSFKGMKETVASVPGEDGADGFSATFRVKDGDNEMQFKGLKSKSMVELIRWTLTTLPKVDDSLTDTQLEELRSGFASVLPVFENFSSKSTLNGITVETDLGVFGVETAAFGLDMNGAVQDGLLREHVSLGKLTMPEGIMPPWAQPFIPERTSVDFSVTGFDLAAPANVILANFSDFVVPIGASDLEDKIMKAFLPTGAVTITLNDVSGKAPAWDVAMDGALTAGEAVRPQGKGTIHSKSLMPLIDALNKAPAEIGGGQAVPAVIAFNAMARKEADGSLRWDIEATNDGKFLVNGVDYAALASLGGGTPAAETPNQP